MCFLCLALAAAALGADAPPPGVIFSTSIAGSVSSGAGALATDAAGNIYLAGATTSGGMQATPGAFQPNFVLSGCVTAASPYHPYICADAYVAKFDAQAHLTFLTYLGGTGNDVPLTVAAASDGGVYVAGYTGSPDFPAAGHAWSTPHIPQPPQQAGFIAKLSGDGAHLLWSTLLSSIPCISPSPDGGVFAVVSDPSVSPLTTTLNRLGPDGSLLATHSVPASTCAVAAEPDGSVAIGGRTDGSDIQATSGAWQNSLGSTWDGFVAKLDGGLTRYLWVTFVGGEGSDQVDNLAVDPSGNIWVTGQTGSAHFPVLANAWQSQPHFPPRSNDSPPPSDLYGGFLVHLSADGAKALASTYLPGKPGSLATDAAGDAVLSVMQQYGFQATPGSQWPCRQRSGFLFSTSGLLKLDASGQHLLWATWSGPYVADGAVTADAQGRVLTAGPASDGLVMVTRLATPAPTPTLVAACINQSGFPYVAGPVAPGEILSIYGAGYGAQAGVSAEIAGGRIGTQLGGVQVLMNGTPAPLLYVSASQINLVAPFEISGSTTATVKIVTTTSASQQVDVPVVPAAPEIFLGSSGSAAILNQDLTVNGPENPAHANDIVAMFVSGAGAMTPAASDGDIPLTAKRKPILPVKVQVQTDTVVNTDAQLTYAGEAPTLVSGAVQINFRVPASNDNLILLTIGDEGPIEAGIYVQ